MMRHREKYARPDAGAVWDVDLESRHVEARDDSDFFAPDLRLQRLSVRPRLARFALAVCGLRGVIKGRIAAIVDARRFRLPTIEIPVGGTGAGATVTLRVEGLAHLRELVMSGQVIIHEMRGAGILLHDTADQPIEWVNARRADRTIPPDAQISVDVAASDRQSSTRYHHVGAQRAYVSGDSGGTWVQLDDTYGTGIAAQPVERPQPASREYAQQRDAGFGFYGMTSADVPYSDGDTLARMRFAEQQARELQAEAAAQAAADAEYENIMRSVDPRYSVLSEVTRATVARSRARGAYSETRDSLLRSGRPPPGR